MNEKAERIIRRATPDDAQALTDLTHRSKGYWGYDADFMRLNRPVLTVTPEQLQDDTAYLLEESGRIRGYYLLEHIDCDTVLLDSLFIEPDAMRSGVGNALWDHAMQTAATLGYHLVVFDSDPHAEGFYLKMGARRVGEKPAPTNDQPDRVLPKMEFTLPS